VLEAVAAVLDGVADAPLLEAAAVEAVVADAAAVESVLAALVVLERFLTW
jgi:hypothetical protein